MENDTGSLPGGKFSSSLGLGRGFIDVYVLYRSVLSVSMAIHEIDYLIIPRVDWCTVVRIRKKSFYGCASIERGLFTR